MAPQRSRPPLPKVAQPRYGRAHDVYNATSAGHQRSETRPGTGWRERRARKLQWQMGGKDTRIESDFGEYGVPGGEKMARPTVMDMLAKPGSMAAASTREPGDEKDAKKDDAREEVREKRGIFDSLVVYVNGSTFPLVSDHRLKQLLVENGARTAIHLGRRQVTHVILGRPNGGAGRGAGGGLAGGKLEKEIRRIGGCGVKYVGVEWVLESIRAGRRLPEARFANLKIAQAGQRSVYPSMGAKMATS